jgi:hypothetical protein
MKTGLLVSIMMAAPLLQLQGAPAGDRPLDWFYRGFRARDARPTDPYDPAKTGREQLRVAIASDIGGFQTDSGVHGLLMRIGIAADVPIGYEPDPSELRSSSFDRPAATVQIEAATLHQALDAVVALDRRYEWREMDGVYVVRTAAAWRDARNLLNRTVGSVHWHGVNRRLATDRLWSLLYPADGCSAPRHAESGGTAAFNIDIENGTLLDVLNAVARAKHRRGEFGWHVGRGGAGDPLKFTVGLGFVRSCVRPPEIQS